MKIHSKSQWLSVGGIRRWKIAAFILVNVALCIAFPPLKIFALAFVSAEEQDAAYGRCPHGVCTNHMYNKSHVQDDASRCTQYDVPWPFNTAWSPHLATRGGDVLYGTGFAQAALWHHQHPTDCRGVRYAKYSPTYTGSPLGLGAVILRFTAAFASALNDGRVFILDESPLHRHQLYDEAWCSSSRSWECYFENLSSCEPRDGDDVMSTDIFDQDPPLRFKELLDCSPVEKSHHLYWWRAQAAAYLARPNRRSRRAMDDFRLRAMLRRSGRAGFVNTVLPTWPPGTIGVVVRANDKVQEAQVYHFSEYLELAEYLAAGNQSLLVRGSLKYTVPARNAGPSFHFPRATFAMRRLFLGTEDSDVFASAAAGVYPGWEMFAIDQHRTKTGMEDLFSQGSTKHGHVMMIQILVALELMLECDAWVLTFSSSWGRLIDGLRATVGRRAFAPMLSLVWGKSAGYIQPRKSQDEQHCEQGCEACYLGCGSCGPC